VTGNPTSTPAASRFQRAFIHAIITLKKLQTVAMIIYSMLTSGFWAVLFGVIFGLSTKKHILTLYVTLTGHLSQDLPAFGI
jgi:hypothetical protein